VSAAEQYARWVLEPGNEHETGYLIKLAAVRFVNDLQRDDLYFDQEDADKFTKFAEEHCCLWEDKWRGKPVKIMPWMHFIFDQIYGWKVKATGLRRIKSVYVQISKKNAKSTLAGILGLFHLYSDKRVNTPKVFVGANNEDQAKICVNITGKIIEQSPDLMDYVDDDTVSLFRYKENIVNIVHNERDGFIKALSKEGSDKKSKTSGGKHGLNPSLGLIDEYGMATTADLLDTLESAQAAREEPLMVTITTSGFNLDGPCYQKLRKGGIEILEGIVEDDSYLPFIFEMDKPLGADGKPEEITIDWLIANEDKWRQSNPNLITSVNIDFLRTRLKKAKREGGTTEVDVKTLNFNIWCDSPEVWIPTDTWMKNSHGFSEDILKNVYQCYAGIEIISGLSLNSLCLMFPNASGDIHAFKWIFWMPEEKVKVNDIKFDFSNFVDEGWIKTTPGNVVDNDLMFDIIHEELQKYYVHSMAFDANIQNNDILQALVKSGLQANPISQSYRGLSEPTKEWEALATKCEIEHFNNPVIKWMNSNCMVLRKGNDVMLEKLQGRISGIRAGIHALAQWKTIEAQKITGDEIIQSWG